MKRTIAPTLAAVALVAAACTGGSDGESRPETDPSVPGTEDPGVDDSVPDSTVPGTDDSGDGPSGPIGFAPAALQRFDECSAFLDYVHTEGAERVGPYGLNDNGWFGPEIFATDVAFAVDEMAEESSGADFEVPADEPAEAQAAPAATDGGSFAADDSAASGDGTFSTTNVQVEGVDEPDIVKSDGDRILAVAGDVLHYVDISDDGTTGTKRGSVSLAANGGDPTDSYLYSYGHEILVSGDRAFVVAQGEGNYYGPIEEPMILEGDVAAPEVVDAVDAIEVVESDDATVDADPAEGLLREVAPTETEPIETEPAEPIDVEADFAEPDIEPLPEPEPLPVDPLLPIGGYWGGPTTIVIEVDLSNPDELVIANTMTLDGRYVSARAIGDTARIVVTSPPKDLGFLYPSNESAVDAAEEANRQLITNSTLEDWLPTYTLAGADGSTATGSLVDCNNIHAPNEFAGFDMLSIVTVDLADDLTVPAASSAVMATGDTVYASADRLYVTSNVWLPPTIDEQQRGQWEEQYETAVHRFSIAGSGPAEYQASGSVEGHLLNQFSMNDRDGTFYVATTTGTPWSSQGSVSQIIAMQVNGDRLEQVGEVGGLGQDERIFSVRYVDDVAYVVTFRQTDPFYVVDLADPTNMTVLGELKIPGFSSYLHPITDTLVLGVGQDATDDGRTTGTKVSLFDVSDPANPLEIDVWTMDNAGSDAEFDHRAFLYWAPTGTAVLPLTNWADQYSGAVVLNVSADGLTEQGRVSHVVDDGQEDGITDCEVFDGSGLTEQDGDLFWMFQEIEGGGSQLQFCGPNDVGGATGFSYCETIPVDQVDNWFWLGEQGRTFEEISGVDLDQVDRIEWCWKDGIDWNKQIRRTMVIDGQLWSFSNSQLQANALADLATTDIVTL